MGHSAEAVLIVESLVAAIPTRLEGVEMITRMRDDGSRNWRQSEWAGFWFEEAARTRLKAEIGGADGPRFGNTTIDYRRDHAWDLKVHSSSSRQGQSRPMVILNDQQAIADCITEHGGIGYVLLIGTATWDNTGEFKAWHDVFKGGQSSYTKRRIARGAGSRPLKISFTPEKLTAIFFASHDELEVGTAGGWLKGFQTGFRNSDRAGTARRPKLQVNIDLLPAEFVLATRDLG